MLGRIQRKYLAHYVIFDNDECELLGRDLEEFSSEMNAKVETKRNILGQNQVAISGYEKSAEVQTYYADEDMPMFMKLQNIIDQNLVLDDLRVQVVEAKLWDNNGDDICSATREDAVIEVLSYGGDANGYQIPFKLHYIGNRVQGSFDLTRKTFTPNA